MRPALGYEWISNTFVALIPDGTPHRSDPNLVWDAAAKRWVSKNKDDLRDAIAEVSRPLRITSAWEATPERREEHRKLASVMANMVDDKRDSVSEAFKRWTAASVVFDRISRSSSPGLGGPPLGVVPGQINVYDSFWFRRDQVSVFTFEAGKALWFSINLNDAQVAVTPIGKQFDSRIRKYWSAVIAMKHAPLRGYDLAELDDRDIQSNFAYVVRAIVLDLNPPGHAPSAYTPQEWERIKGDWPKARDELRELLKKTLSVP
jgi:hypothetical protein